MQSRMIYVFKSATRILNHYLDRTSLNKDPGSRYSQVYAQLAHAVVRFLALNSPQEMEGYGMDSAADLLDLISRVCGSLFRIFQCANFT